MELDTEFGISGGFLGAVGLFELGCHLAHGDGPILVFLSAGFEEISLLNQGVLLFFQSIDFLLCTLKVYNLKVELWFFKFDPVWLITDS